MRGSCAPAGTVCGHLWLDRVVVHYVGDSSHRQVLSVQECGLGAHAMEGELSTTSADFYPEYNTSTIAYGRSTFALWAVHQCTRV